MSQSWVYKYYVRAVCRKHCLLYQIFLIVSQIWRDFLKHLHYAHLQDLICLTDMYQAKLFYLTLKLQNLINFTPNGKILMLRLQKKKPQPNKKKQHYELLSFSTCCGCRMLLFVCLLACCCFLQRFDLFYDPTCRDIHCSNMKEMSLQVMTLHRIQTPCLVC